MGGDAGEKSGGGEVERNFGLRPPERLFSRAGILDCGMKKSEITKY
jgi:hypothetical protein